MDWSPPSHARGLRETDDLTSQTLVAHDWGLKLDPQHPHKRQVWQCMGVTPELGRVIRDWIILGACWLVILAETERSMFRERLSRNGNGGIYTHRHRYMHLPQTWYTHVTFSLNIQMLICTLNFYVIWSKSIWLFCTSSPPLAMQYQFPQMAPGRNRLKLSWLYDFMCDVPYSFVVIMHFCWLHICSVSLKSLYRSSTFILYTNYSL